MGGKPNKQPPPNLEYYKITFLGDGGIGSKSAFLERIISGTFKIEYDPTIEDSYRKQINCDGQEIVCDMLDTCGQEEYSALRERTIRYAEGFLIGYAVNSRMSFECLQSRYIDQIVKYQDKQLNEIPIVLVGNKIDLVNDRQVSCEEGASFARNFGIPFFEISVKDNHNVSESLMCLLRLMKAQKEKERLQAKSRRRD